jgi:AAA15 family ATPase/GTPase
MIRARGGVLAVDEVENGLHHSIQQDVWDFLLAMAEELRVQVFATTHSWESVTAFQSSANRSRVKGMLYRLERKGDGSSRVERYTEEEVAIAAEQRIEVR